MKINIGVLTAGGDSPGLNSAIRAIGKSAYQRFDAQVIGFLYNWTMPVYPAF